MTLLCIGLMHVAGLGQSIVQTPAQSLPNLDTDSVAPARFIAAHGRRSLISGYASGGLEVWAYPFQILNDYHVSFHTAGSTTLIDGQTILRRVTYNDDSITRVYLGPDFIVRETLFVPLNDPGAIITYAVESARPVDIDIRATPILDLMWPASVGGQSAAWNPSLSAFVVSETTDSYSAIVGSPDIIAHDELGNRTTQGTTGPSLGFTLHPSSTGDASVYVALSPPAKMSGNVLFRKLISQRDKLEQEYDQHVAETLGSTISVTTPDEEVNRAVAWSELALDQAWVCNPDLGCGYVAGYGPSRGARRPQYDWFFAGDGLIAANAAAMAGNSSQAHDELAFILRYQDKKTGMIWHELSQSAGLIDWVGKYPYMYVHVDITFQFLATLGRYIAFTGDTQFIREHWQAIDSAYRYCESLIDPATNLPRIPSDKEGGDEQDRMSDDLGLSASWVEATAAFEQLATLNGHGTEATAAATANQRARASISKRYWDPQDNYWLNGHVESGQAVPERRSSPSEVIPLKLFTPQQNDDLLYELASASFQTDWGSRGVAANSKGFDPTSYAKGSISALGTADLATTFWVEHRSTQAFAIWSSLLPWFSLDSLGHLHEVLAGNVYQPQEESVPEQTWSSAGFVASTLQGLLGLHVDALARKVTFAPHFPSTWHDLSVSNVFLSGAKLSFKVHQSTTEIDLDIDNPGPSFSLIFAPTLALGATADRVELNQRPLQSITTQDLPDTVATVNCEAPHGVSHLHMFVHGGVSLIVSAAHPLLGDASDGIHIIDAHLAGNTLNITADVPADQHATIDIATDWVVSHATNARVDIIAPNLKRITFQPQAETPVIDHSQRVKATLQLEH